MCYICGILLSEIMEAGKKYFFLVVEPLRRGVGGGLRALVVEDEDFVNSIHICCYRYSETANPGSSYQV